MFAKFQVPPDPGVTLMATGAVQLAEEQTNLILCAVKMQTKHNDNNAKCNRNIVLH